MKLCDDYNHIDIVYEGKECEKCGEEASEKMVGDEVYVYCKECNWITH